MEKICSTCFYVAWEESVKKCKKLLSDNWRKNPVYTSHIFSENGILDLVAQKLGLLYYSNYYFIDAVFYKPEDVIKENEFWFRDIRIAFEHENNFRSGLYKEVSHLLTTNADLKVLVSYPNGEINDVLDYLHSIISKSRQAKAISDNKSFLLILGYEKKFCWEGSVYNENGWKPIES
ncbi:MULTISPECIES: hypothetical protein [Flavobacterium]|uniref:hypothetical protein n=1 Tax=Flavobacterium TaxID=237 RepID=UPI00280A189F|nr:hypothetical protein [Flavobacterium lindanitolerans]MDQ7960393.1 hypothetical protein [Flavobacterium lindanitolerans]